MKSKKYDQPLYPVYVDFRDKDAYPLPPSVATYFGVLYKESLAQMAKAKQEFEAGKYNLELQLFERLKEIACKLREMEQARTVYKAPLTSPIKMPDGSIAEYYDLIHSAYGEVLFHSYCMPGDFTNQLRHILAMPFEQIKNHDMFVHNYDNLMAELYYRLDDATDFFQNEVCEACGWQDATFSGKLARARLIRPGKSKEQLTEAEAEKVLAIFEEVIIPSLQMAAKNWRAYLKSRKENKTV